MGAGSVWQEHDDDPAQLLQPRDRGGQDGSALASGHPGDPSPTDAISRVFERDASALQVIPDPVRAGKVARAPRLLALRDQPLNLSGEAGLLRPDHIE